MSSGFSQRSRVVDSVDYVEMIKVGVDKGSAIEKVVGGSCLLNPQLAYGELVYEKWVRGRKEKPQGSV
jgi:hypothetical protein